MARDKQELEADDFYFWPTFLRSAPAQTVTLEVTNDGERLHNFSISAQQIDVDIPARYVVDIQTAFPQSGATLFFCKYHQAQGMNGQLLVGDAQPPLPISR